MLQALFGRLLGRWAPPVRPLSRSSVRAAHPPAPTIAPAPSALPVPVGARRPLVSSQGGIAGFEFHLGEATVRRLCRRPDNSAAHASTGNLLGAMRLCAKAGQLAFGELAAAWLLSVAQPGSVVAGMHLALDAGDGEAIDHTTLAERIVVWRAAGAEIGWAMQGAPTAVAGLRPDFHTLHAGTSEMPALLTCLRGQPADVPLVALDLPGIDALEAALHTGVRFAACRLGSSGSELAEARPLQPQTRHLLSLMSQLACDADTREVVAAIKHDVSLSYRLLRQLNSASISPVGELGSIEQAVAVLGRNELYRWVCVLLVRQAPARPASPALQAMALARARLLELLAEAAGEDRPGALFTLGLASMLPLLLQTRLPDALAALQLHPDAVLALLERQGPWLPYLRLAEALDAGDMLEADQLAAAFGGMTAVMVCATRAWLYATQPTTPG